MGDCWGQAVLVSGFRNLRWVNEGGLLIHSRGDLDNHYPWRRIKKLVYLDLKKIDLSPAPI